MWRFDLVDAWRATGPSFDPENPFTRPDLVPTNLAFRFQTLAGESRLVSVAPGSFVGALLFDDAFQFVSLMTSAGCFCSTGFTIDNLAVQAVPEPATLLLLSGGVVGVLVLRQFRRR